MSTYHNARIVYEMDGWRILEIPYSDADMANLKGDVYNLKHILEMHGPTKTIEELRREEMDFEEMVEREGVFGFVLEKWNSEIGAGWEHIDSCWGFIGAYSPTDQTFNHYIVDELKRQIK